MINSSVVFLSHKISKKTPLHGGKKILNLKMIKSFTQNGTCNTMQWSFSNHTGTHIDAPLHFLAEGRSITDFKAADWIFKKISLIKLKDIFANHIITSEDLGALMDCELLLIKTNFEINRAKNLYWMSSPGLHPDLAGWFKSSCPSLRAVGVDFISISSLADRELGRRAHREFFEKGIILIEDMKLSLLKEIPNTIIAVPLLVEGADASPCTVLGIYN